ncbi:serine/threonine-protein phosphatase 6 catalytic subunit [Harpegnathos saltator]|uniref:Serine/threonine-protein phosphatase n=1 Tax=Harpegnathos saltator TaxID=610380 RepID=E2B693_HARSA|nr:serine/threonine-protein phosphatase 6 catalytic subunit [Harpegnathos saltator]XP_032663207.1 serine/threonine-protein phosphatase 6 catalytic subunit [Odontomachus brunneus]EFN88786.1 Serine/threonine-protein phosphatase 6 [Harpegnathos saltator]
MSDVDRWIDIAKECKYLPENDLKKLCDIVCDLLLEESNIQPVSTPVTVCGDIHGQFYDLEELFRNGGQVPDTNYIFLGDFVDRGYYSLETFTRLLTLKAKWSDRITLLRGNHESRQITHVYGFYDECQNKYGNANAWKYCCRVFDLLTVAALIDEQVLCVHGGLSPAIRTLDQIRTIERNQEIPHKGAFCDLVWSDPEDVETWSVSPRGAGWLFGSKVTYMFMEVNDLKLICRAHQLVHEGYRYMFNDKLVTVWSAPNYCYRCGNIASILQFTTVDQRTPVLFQAVPDSERVIPPLTTTPYFL